MTYSHEVEHMCVVKKGPWLGPFFTTHMCSTSCE